VLQGVAGALGDIMERGCGHARIYPQLFCSIYYISICRFACYWYET